MSEEIKFEISDKEYYILPVNSKIMSEAQKVYNRAFRRGIEGGALLKKRLDQYMREQGLWDDVREAEYRQIVKDIAELEYKLNKGGIKLDDAKVLALKLRDRRENLRSLITERSSLDSLTAEGQADNERFDYFVSACVYDSLTRKPVFSSLEDYVNKKDSDLSSTLASKFAAYMYGLDEDYESTLVETRFLKRFKFIDDKGRMIDKEGKFIDEEGNFVDEDGNRVDREGNRIDINNNPILESTVDDVEFIE